MNELISGEELLFEKLEKFTDVGFGIVLYTPDDGEAVPNQAKLK